MNTERDTELLLRQWLDEGPTRAADRLVETVERRIDRQRQRPVWRLTWRNLFMNRTIGSFAAGMAVVAVALIGLNVFAGRGSDGPGIGAPAEPSAPVAATASPTPTSAPESPPPPGDGLTVTFSAAPPAGWSQGDNEVLKGEDAAVEVLEDRSVMSAYPDCIYGPTPGIGKGAAEIVNALSTRDGLDVTGLAPVEVHTLSGQVLEIAVATGFADRCSWQEDDGPAIVPTVGGFDEKNNWLFSGISGDQLQRLYVLDKPGGGNVVVMAWASTADLWAANEADMTSIVRGIEFDIGS